MSIGAKTTDEKQGRGPTDTRDCRACRLERQHTHTCTQSPLMHALLSGPGRRASAAGAPPRASGCEGREVPSTGEDAEPAAFTPRLLAWAGVPAVADALAYGPGGWLAVRVCAAGAGSWG